MALVAGCGTNDNTASPLPTASAAAAASPVADQPTDEAESIEQAVASCSGTPGQWSGCRGNGCLVCTENTAKYPYYFINHPLCGANPTCDASFSTCNVNCPAPTCADKVLSAGSQCSGTPGQWSGCRGNGCAVCNEKVSAYPYYFANHPSCVRNTTCNNSNFGTCNANCPAPTDADKAPLAGMCQPSASQWQGCGSNGCVVCAEKLTGYPKYFLNHPNCVQVSCGGTSSSCNSNCPAPTDADKAVPREAVWAPSFDQFAQGYFEDCLNNDCNHEDPLGMPDFDVGTTTTSRNAIIDRALSAAYQKGVRALDINFYTSPATQPQPPGQTAKELAYQTSLTSQGTAWLKAVDRLNAAITGSDYMRLRIRVSASSQFLKSVLYRTNPSKYAQDQLIPNAYRDTGLDPIIVDLSNANIRQAISDFTALVLDGVYSIAGANTAVEMVSLALDSGGESSAYPDPNEADGVTKYNGPGRISYSDSIYPVGGSFAQKVSHFQKKQAALKATYATFANAVHSYRYMGGANKGLKAGVFMQLWAMDGYNRGAFDLAALVKGTGIDVIHHTQNAISPDQSARSVAYTASLARYLKLPFDTEFTWPWFPYPSAVGAPLCTGCYDAAQLQANGSAMADVTYYQGVYGTRNGATGITYANWDTLSFTAPPPVQKWNNAIGASDCEHWSSDFLVRPATSTAPAGMLSFRTWPPATKAIYISTLGRIYCEEQLSSAQPGTRPPGSCDFGTYAGWFEQFGVNYRGEAIDIITDQMIKDSAADPAKLLNKYQYIFVPRELQKYTDHQVRAILDSYSHSSGAATFWVQGSVGSTSNSGYQAWSTDASYSSF